MARILVLGAGVMGTAITVPLADNGHDVNLVGTHLDNDEIECLIQSHVHPRLLSSIPESVHPYKIDQLSSAIEDVDLVIIGVNLLGIRWAARTLVEYINPEVLILFLTKGLDGTGEELRLLLDAFRESLPEQVRERLPLAAIGGPSIANGLAARRHSCVVLAGEQLDLLERWQKALQTSYYHMSISTDLIGVEVSVGLKNLYAIGVGLIEGIRERAADSENLAVKYNMAASLFTQSLHEMAYLVKVMGGKLETVYALAGVGDLYVTCHGGRNCRMGRYIGTGLTYAEAKTAHMAQDTIEGAEIAFAIDEIVQALAACGDLDPERIPLLLTLLDILCRDNGAAVSIEAYFSNLPS